MQPRAPGRTATLPAEFVKRNYHWLFAGLAALLVLGRFVPAVYLSAVDSDNIQIPLLFHDVVELGRPAREWVWGGHSDIFPDITLVFLLEFILRDGLRALQAASCIFLGAYVAVLVALYRQNGGRNTGTFASAVALFFVLLLINFGARDGMQFISISSFVVPMHTSIAISALGCFALCQRAALRGWGRLSWLLPVLCFGTALSNDLFLVIFTGPVLAALAVGCFLYPARVRSFAAVFAAVLIGSATGHFLARPLSPFQIDAGPFTSFHASAAAAAWHQLMGLCTPRMGGVFFVLTALDFLFVIIAGVVLGAQCFRPAEKRIAPVFFLLLAYSTYAIACNWGAVILTGDFTGVLASRYTRLAMLLPVFYLIGCASHFAPLSKAANPAVTTIVSVAICVCAVFLAPPPSRYYEETQQLVPIIRETMEKEHIEAGLADYWYANPIVFFSGNTLPVRAVAADGSLFHWVNSLDWYSDHGTSDPSRFRLILMANLDPDRTTRRYGKPAQVIQALPGKDIWIYAPEQAITYNPHFWTLSNGDPNELRFDGDMLPSMTGRIEGRSHVARAERDRPGFIIFGPYPYLRPEAGRYRVTIFYTYLAAPAPDKLAGYEATYSINSKPHKLAEGSLPFTGTSPHEFTREITIPDDQRGLFEVLTLYNGSGDVSVDSLMITWLGK